MFFYEDKSCTLSLQVIVKVIKISIISIYYCFTFSKESSCNNYNNQMARYRWIFALFFCQFILSHNFFNLGNSKTVYIKHKGSKFIEL